MWWQRWGAGCCAVVLTAWVAMDAEAQTKKRAPAKKAPAPATQSVDAEVTCPAELGTGTRTKRTYCDVLTGREPESGVLIAIPPHRGTVTLTFDLHNRHTYSEELVKAKKAFRQYTATIGVLTLDNTLIERAVVRSEFRTAEDLVDRIAGGAGPGGVKAVAPSGVEHITIELPEDVGEQVSLLGESLRVQRPDGEDNFSASGRPIATVSNIKLQYRPAPARRTPKRPD